MSDWAPMWTKRAGRSLKVLLKQLQYAKPLELLTCFAGLLGDSAIDKHSTYEFRKPNHAITKERAKVKAHSFCHVEGNPTVIVQTVLSTRGLHAPPVADDVHPGQDTMPPSCTLLCRGELCKVVPIGVEVAL